MNTLPNARQERFAQGVAQGLSQLDAYTQAGYSGGRTCAARMATNASVKLRIDTLKAKGAEKAELTIERVLREYMAVAFADIGEAIQWDGQQVILKDSNTVSPDVRRAIASVSEQPAGGVKLQFHSKLPALDALAKHLGIFTDAAHVQVQVNTGEQKGPPRAKDMGELMQMIADEDIRRKLLSDGGD